VSRAARRTVVLMAVLPLLLVGCGAGRGNQTYHERTVADATNTSVGTIAVRGLALEPPADGELYPAGATVRGTMTLVNQSDQPDQLLSVTSDAGSVRLLQGAPSAATQATAVPVPPTGTATPGFELRGLTRAVRPGEYVRMTFAFERSGSAQLLVPVATGDAAAPRNQRRPARPEGTG